MARTVLWKGLCTKRVQNLGWIHNRVAPRSIACSTSPQPQRDDSEANIVALSSRHFTLTVHYINCSFRLSAVLSFLAAAGASEQRWCYGIAAIFAVTDAVKNWSTTRQRLGTEFGGARYSRGASNSIVAIYRGDDRWKKSTSIRMSTLTLTLTPMNIHMAG